MGAKGYVGTLRLSLVRLSRLLWTITMGVCLITLVLSTLLSTLAAAQVPPGFSSELIRVRFSEGTDVDPPEDALSSSGLVGSVADIHRLFTLPEAKLNELRQAGENSSGNELPDLNMWFEINLVPATDAVIFLQDLKALPYVTSLYISLSRRCYFNCL
jgi:hypothetical protein